MKIRLVLILITITILYLNNCRADEKFMHITIKEGLSQSSVQAICQDFRGYMWFGTGDGLNKYDGFNITKFYHDPTTSHSVCSNNIKLIYENPYDSTLYIGTSDAGISIYNRNNDSFKSINNTLPAKDIQNINNITGMVATDKYNLWILSHGNGIFNYNIKDSSLFSPSFNREQIFQESQCIITDSEGNLWIGTNDGLYSWNYDNSISPHKIELIKGTKNTTITKIKFDIKGNLYIGTRNSGLLKYNPYSKHTEIIYKQKNNLTLFSKLISDILITRNNTLWIATKSGLFKKENNKIESYRNNPLIHETINNNDILSLFEDNSGIIWIGTFLGGVNIYDYKTSLFPKYKDFSPQLENDSDFYHNYNSIYAIFIDNKKSVWLNTSEGLLELKQSYFATKQVAGNVIRHYNKLTIGNIYYNNNYGLYLSFGDGICLRHNNGSLEKLSSAILKQTGKYIPSFITAFADSDGAMWFSTYQGLLKFNPMNYNFKLINIPAINNKVLPSSIITIIENYEGKLLMGTNNGKLLKFDRHIETTKSIIPHIENDESPNFTKIFSIHESAPEQIWLGTNTGMYFLNNKSKKHKHFFKQNSQSINVIYGILEDDRGNLWCTSNNGLIVYNNKNETFQNFTSYEGLQSNEFNQDSYNKSEDGTFYIGGINGLNIFHPDDIQPDNLIPPLIIDKLEILYKPVNPTSHHDILKKQLSETESITLSYKQATFSFDYIALCYRQPGRINYKYMLEGFDDKWVEAGNRRIATYTKIDPGEYTFKVINTNNYGAWSKKPVSIKIIIPPPFWQTIWFRLLLLFIIISAFYIIIYFKTKGNKYQKTLLAATVVKKTKTLNEQKIKIEQQNHELVSINKIVTQKNKNLNDQHKHIQVQHKELIALTRKLKETNQAKLQFFTSISHEFRTPLTLITSPLQDIIKNNYKFTKIQLIRHLKTVYSNASKLLLLIDQLLDFRKAEVGNEKLIMSKIEIISFTKQIILLFNDLATKNNIKTIFTSSNSKIEITADSLKIEKIITNLISNAFKHSPVNKEISINIKQIKSEKYKRAIQFSISDLGEGIDNNSIAYIFNRFYHSDENHSKQGSGLGLALVKKYIELHNGTITVNSQQETGTTFSFTLPVNEHKPNSTIEKTLIPLKNNSQQLLAGFKSYFPINLNIIETSEDRKKQRILIIEDDKDLTSYLKDALSSYYNITATKSAEEGFLIAISKNPNLIITDIMLKGMNGFDFCNKLKSHFNTRHIPIILLSALSDHENIINGLSYGAIDYITKPFDMNYLILKINNLLHLKQALQTKLLQDSQITTNELIHKKDKAFLNKIVECVEANISDSSYTVDHLCKNVGISHPQAYRKIKSLTNLSISAFIRNVRLKKAAMHLLSGEKKINEIAYEVGFSDPNYFTKCFTNLYEQTPREFIKNAQK